MKLFLNQTAYQTSFQVDWSEWQEVAQFVVILYILLLSVITFKFCWLHKDLKEFQIIFR